MMLGKIGIGLLRVLIAGALVAATGLVFVVCHDYPEPTVTGRFFAFCRLIPALGLLALPALFFGKYRFTLTDLLVGLYTLYFVLHSHLTDNPAEQRLILGVCLAQLYFFLRVFRSFWPSAEQWALLALFVAGCGQAMLGLKQIYGFTHSYHGLYAVTGSFFNPGPYGGYMAVLFCLALSYVVRRYRAFERLYRTVLRRRRIEMRQVFPALLYIAGGCCAALSFLVIPASMSRSAWVAVVGAGGLIAVVECGLWSYLKQTYQNYRKASLLIGAAVVLLLAAGTVGVYTLKRGSADGRLLAWKVTARAIADHPTGTGVGAFGGAYAEAQSALFDEGRLSAAEIKVADSPAYAFNEYLQITLEQGWVGLLLFAAIVGLSFRCFRTRHSEWHYALIALLLFALTSYPFRVLPLLILAVFAVGMQANGIVLSGTRWSRVIGTLLLCASLPFNLSMLKEIPSSEAAYREWKSLQTFYRMELFDNELADDYAKLRDRLAGEVAYWFEYGRTLNKSVRPAESTPALEQGARLSSDPMFYNVMGNNYRALGEPDSAAAMYEKAFSILPNRLYPLYLLAELYHERGDTLKATQYARRMLEFNPKVDSPATEEMKEEVRGWQ